MDEMTLFRVMKASLLSQGRVLRIDRVVDRGWSRLIRALSSCCLAFMDIFV
jgi:hypothetical protein